MAHFKNSYLLFFTATNSFYCTKCYKLSETAKVSRKDNSEQCDRIGRFLKVLGNKLSNKSGPNTWQFSGLLWKALFCQWLRFGYCLEILGYLLFQHLVTLITNKKVSFYEEVVYEEVVAATHLAECQNQRTAVLLLWQRLSYWPLHLGLWLLRPAINKKLHSFVHCEENLLVYRTGHFWKSGLGRAWSFWCISFAKSILF